MHEPSQVPGLEEEDRCFGAHAIRYDEGLRGHAWLSCSSSNSRHEALERFSGLGSSSPGARQPLCSRTWEGQMHYVGRSDGGNDGNRARPRAGRSAVGEGEGDVASGEARPIADPRTEIAELYKVSKLKVSRGEGSEGVPPPGTAHRRHLPSTHRRLAKNTYESKCATRIWGAKMAVEMIIDHWNPSQVRYRTLRRTRLRGRGGDGAP